VRRQHELEGCVKTGIWRCLGIGYPTDAGLAEDQIWAIGHSPLGPKSNGEGLLRVFSSQHKGVTVKAGYRLIVARRLPAFSAVRHIGVRREGEKAANRLPAFFERVNL
jgi:hypothetical protein